MYSEVLVELNNIVNDDNNNLMDKQCNCINAKLNGYNNVCKAYTMRCVIACRCGKVYCNFVFGEKVDVDGRLYQENGLRFSALTQHCKLRFCLGEKLDMYFGLQCMDRRTYRKYKDCVDEKSKVLAVGYMDDAIEEGIQDKKK